ncbi:MAG: DUF2283 domain-containing protein [archaeon]|nr:DUF2283 domain-containing protein [archaeon]MCP8314998.1 DUF2283 domain-containing protein [archaeon]
MSASKALKVDYSPDVDALIITLSDEKPEYGEDIGSGIIIHYSKDAKPVEVEILNASEIITSSVQAIIRRAKY